MPITPSESCEHCNRFLIHPVATACPRGRRAALRAIDGVRTLVREVATAWSNADAAHSVVFKNEADEKARAKAKARAEARARRRKREPRRPAATAGQKLPEQEITEQQRPRSSRKRLPPLLWSRWQTFIWNTTALEAGLGLYGVFGARPPTNLEAWLGLDGAFRTRSRHLPTCLFCSQPNIYKNGRCFYHATREWLLRRAKRVAPIGEVKAAAWGLSSEETGRLRRYAVKRGDPDLYAEALEKILDGPTLPPGEGRKWKPERVGFYTFFRRTIESLADNKKRAERVRAGMKGREEREDKIHKRRLTAEQSKLREAAERSRAEGAARRAADPDLAGIDKELARAAERRLQGERGPQIFNVFVRRWTPAESRELGWGNFAERRPIPGAESLPDRPASSAFRDRGLSRRLALSALEQDPGCLEIVNGLEEGLSAEDIRSNHGFTELEYSTNRRRLLRKTAEKWTGRPDEEGTPSAADEDEMEPGEGWSTTRLLKMIGTEQWSGTLEEEYPD